MSTPIPPAFHSALTEIYQRHYAAVATERDGVTLRAAWCDWLPAPLHMQAIPIRANTPAAGCDGYEPETKAPSVDWGEWGARVMAFLLFVAICAAAGLIYAKGGVIR